jgi:hypothetical protein
VAGKAERRRGGGAEVNAEVFMCFVWNLSVKKGKGEMTMIGRREDRKIRFTIQASPFTHKSYKSR